MQENSLTAGRILPALLRFSVPLLLALLLQAMYGAVDLLVVGRFGDASGVSAVSTGSQIIQTITGIVTGLTMGPTILVGQCIGARDEERAAQVVGTTICLFAIVAAVLTAVMALVTRPVVALMNAPVQAFEQTVGYVFVCSLGCVFIVAYNAISGILRGMGNSKLPLVFVAIACGVNIAGDLLLVGVLHLGAVGAAVATVAAQGVSVVLSVAILRARGLPFPFGRRHIRLAGGTALGVLRLGAPIALQDALTNVSFLAITGILNSMGLIVSAAVGVAEKVVVFIMLVPMAFMSAISAFVAQNIGAGQPRRAYRSLYCGVGIALCFGVAMFCLTFWQGGLLAGIFTADTRVVAAAAEYLRAYAIDCVLVCALFGMMGFLNGCGETLFVMVQGLAAAFLVRIPFSWFMSRRGAGMFQIGLATPLATALGIVLCALYFRRVRGRLTRAAGAPGKTTA